MKKNLFISAVLAAAISFSCNDKGVLEPENSLFNGEKILTREDDLSTINTSFYRDYIVFKDTIVTYKAKKLPDIPKNLPDLTNIKNNIELKGKPFRMIATGGSLLAGMKTGGYYNEAMETSVPNLIARQMGIDFKQPYFDASDYNGFGRVAPTNMNLTGGPVQKYNIVRNNLGVLEKDPQGRVNLRPYNGDRIDNFAGYDFYGYDHSIERKDYNNPIIDRIIGNEKSITTLRERILKEKFDFIIEGSGFFELRYGFNSTIGNFPNGFEGYLDKKPGPMGSYMIRSYDNRLSFLLAIKNRGNIKGLLINHPSMTNLPLYNIIKPSDVEQQFKLYASEHLLPNSKIAMVIPTSRMDSLVGKNVHVNLKPWIADGKKMKELEDYLNLQIISNNDAAKVRILENTSLAKQLNFALLDLDDLYRRITTNSYTSHDGIKVESKNFFEADGYSPTDLGNAIIANEAILVINKQYNLKMPLISTRDFLDK